MVVFPALWCPLRRTANVVDIPFRCRTYGHTKGTLTLRTAATSVQTSTGREVAEIGAAADKHGKAWLKPGILVTTMAVSNDFDAVGLWRTVDHLTAKLTVLDQYAVRGAVARGIFDGWRPTASEVATLVAATAGTLSPAQYLAVVAQATRGEGCWIHLPNRSMATG